MASLWVRDVALYAWLVILIFPGADWSLASLDFNRQHDVPQLTDAGARCHRNWGYRLLYFLIVCIFYFLYCEPPRATRGWGGIEIY